MSQAIFVSGRSLFRILWGLLNSVIVFVPKRRPAPTDLIASMTTGEWADLPTWHPASPEE
jgi:hypothetical protein